MPFIAEPRRAPPFSGVRSIHAGALLASSLIVYLIAAGAIPPPATLRSWLHVLWLTLTVICILAARFSFRPPTSTESRVHSPCSSASPFAIFGLGFSFGLGAGAKPAAR